MMSPFLVPNAMVDIRWAADIYYAFHRNSFKTSTSRSSTIAFFHRVRGSSARVAVQRNSRTMRRRFNEEAAAVDRTNVAGIDHAVETRARVPKRAPATTQISTAAIWFGSAVPLCARIRVAGAHIFGTRVGLRAFATVYPAKLNRTSLV